MDALTPRPGHRFTFGLWTVGNTGRDPFGHATRPPLPPERAVRRLAELGAYGVNLHDEDLVPFDASAAERDRIVRDFRKVLEDTGLRVPMATTNLFSQPVFRDGAFTSHDRRVREFALGKTMRAMDLGVELGAQVFVFWGGREGVETDAAKDPVEAIRRYRECLNYLCAYARDRKYDIRFALEAKPNEPRGDIYLPTTGAMLAFIETLDHPGMVGVNPEVAHEHMAGLNMTHAVAQAIERGKLFHIDLNDQRPGRYDQDFRFGSENPKAAFFLVQLLEDRNWGGCRHFDAHAYRTEDEDGVFDFAAGCMRTYLILAGKAQRFREDREIQALRSEIAAHGGGPITFSPAAARELRDRNTDAGALAARGLLYERLDQLVTELLLGAR